METRAQAPFSISDVGFSKHNILNMNKNNNYLHLKSFVDQILIFQDRFLRGLIPKQSSNYLSSKETSDESFEYHWNSLIRQSENIVFSSSFIINYFLFVIICILLCLYACRQKIWEIEILPFIFELVLVHHDPCE